MKLYTQVKLSAFMAIVLMSYSCKDDASEIITPVPPDATVVPPVEPEIAHSVGFFLGDWQPKLFTVPTFIEAANGTTASIKVTVDASSIVTKIPPGIFGHNAVWWMGNPTAQAVNDITKVSPRIVRFPGGSSSDNYFFNRPQDELPDDVPSTHIDKDGNKLPSSYNYGMTTHDWEFSLEKYYSLLQQTESEGIITVNYAYARYSTAADPVASAAHLAADWVRYDNGRTQYWELGNENYGDWESGYRIDLALNKDGQPEFITGELYAKHAKVFIDSMQKAAGEIGKKIYIGAVIHESPATESWQTPTTKTWNSGLIPTLADKADFYVVHNYFTGSDNANSATILSAARTVPGSMMQYVLSDLAKYGGAIKPIAFDEWNMFASGSKQQVSNTSGVFATIVMGEAITHQYGMAARWDLLNGWSGGDDHGLFSPGDEPGIPKWNPRPSFYYLYFFQKLLGDRMVPTTVTGSTSIVAYGSTFSSGEINVALINTGTTPQSLEVDTRNFNMGERFYLYTLEGGTDNAEFSRKVIVNGKGPTLDAGGPSNYSTIEARSAKTTDGIKVIVPAHGVIIMAIDQK